VGNKKSLFLVITSLTFLISGAICSQLSVPLVYADTPNNCFTVPDLIGCSCKQSKSGYSETCCWIGNDGLTKCQTCDRDIDTGDHSNCTPSPEGVAPPPPTESCPENIARDAQGNCTPLTQTPEGPVPKGGLGNLLPEGVFEGLTTPPQQQKITPEIAPLPPTCPPGQVLDEDTNLCFRVSQEQEEQQQQSEVTEEEQPIPVCQEGLEFNENLGFCVPEDCPEGQVLDEESGICVLEEPEVAEDPAQSEPQEEQSEPEQPEQQSSEGDGSQDNGNSDDN
jgi:hypothetical protein